MIKIEKDDSIIDIIQKIKKEKSDDVVLNFPFGHHILHNYLSLKILKNKTGNKNITIITSDLTSRKIGKKLGINYSIKKDKKFAENSKKAEIIRHNMGFFEYFFYEIKRFFRLLFSSLSKKSKIDEFKKYSLKYYNKSGVGIFFLILFLSIFIFIIVIFFIINKTYIEIKPEINIKTVGYNFIFKDFGNKEDSDIDDRIIKLKKISKVIEKEENFNTTGVDAGLGQKSYGKVILYNKFLEDIHLKKNTRFQSKNGLIFESTKEIDIPAGSKNFNGKITPGILKIDIIAQNYDTSGKYIGVRGNKIKKKDKFSLPGLKDDNKDKIYAEAIENFKGGKDIKERILGEKDLENAKKIFSNKLKKEAIEEVKKYLKEQNSLNNATYDILSYDSIYNNSEIEIKPIKNIKIGDKIKSFKLKGSINFSSYIYNKSSVINKLEKIVNEKIIQNEEIEKGKIEVKKVETLKYIDKNSLRKTYKIYEKNSPKYEVKYTLEIDAYMHKNFLNKNSAYVYKLKNSIYGLSKKEAEKILLNDKNIRSVKIYIQPFFINKISNIEKNVIFEIKD